MLFGEIEEGFAAEARTRYGYDVRLRLKYIQNYIYYTISSDRGAHSHFSEKMSSFQILRKKSLRSDERVRQKWDIREFEAIPLSEKIEAIIIECDEMIAENGRVYNSFTKAKDSYIKEFPNSLKDVKLNLERDWKSENSLSCEVVVSWMGYGDHLLLEKQEIPFYFYGCEDNLIKRACRAMKEAAAKESKRAKLAEKGLTLDAPLRHLLVNTKSSQDGLLKAAENGELLKSESGIKNKNPFHFVDHEISLSFTDGKVQSVIKLNEKITWAKGCLVIRDTEFPETVLMALKGKPLRSVVDHPWLDNLVVTSASSSRSKKNEACTTFMTKEI